MKSKCFALVSAVMLTAAASLAVAGHYGEHKEGHHGGHHGKSFFIQRYDQNDDAQVTADEFEQARRARYDLTDEDDNGLIDVDEYVQGYAGRLNKKIERERKGHIKQTRRRFGALDKNDNEQIEWEEYEASGERSFKRFDVDENGVINADDPRPKRSCKHKCKGYKGKGKGDKADAGHDHEHGEDYKRHHGKHKGMCKKYAKRVIHMPTTHRKKGMMRKYDTDKDGSITHEEFSAKRRADFDRTDEDGDGRLNSEEYALEFGNRLDEKIEKTREKKLKRAKKRFGVMDKDENGGISFEEYQVSGQKMFSRHDTNEDGVVSESDRPRHKHGKGHKDHSAKSRKKERDH